MTQPGPLPSSGESNSTTGLAYLSVNRPDVEIIRATSSDQREPEFEAEGAYLSATEMAPAPEIAGASSKRRFDVLPLTVRFRAHDVHVPGILVDHVVETPDMLQTTAKPNDPEIPAS